MNEQFPLFLYEVNIVPLNGFYFRLPECEFDRDDINVYVEWFDLNDGVTTESEYTRQLVPETTQGSKLIHLL